jgi:dTDP-glucose 4,6-dehydratase
VRVLVTGAAGFVGAHLVEELASRHHDVVALDCLTYAGDLASLKGIKCEWICYDFSEPLPDLKVDAIVHCGAESHVDHAFADPSCFVRSNLIGALNVLELARRNPVTRFIYVSTDEVFGPDRGEPFEEDDRLEPTNPYSATKAGAEHLAWGHHRAFGVPVIVTRMPNVFGPRQHREKFIPRVVGQILRNEVVEIHEGPGGVGSRRWCYVGEVARALAFLVDNGTTGQTYHLAEGTRRTNLEVASAIAEGIGYPWQHRVVASPRKSYDESYWLRESRYASCWKGSETFESRLKQTVGWYLDHMERL